MKRFCLSLILFLLPIQSFASAATHYAMHKFPRIDARSFVPGYSLGPISIGMTKKEVFNVLNSKPNHVYGHTIEDDNWSAIGPNSYTSLDILYRHGRVIQIELHSDHLISTKFSTILHSKKWSFRLKVYGVGDQNGAGYVGYYDDRNHGICYCGGAQDDFILDQYSPDTLIIHSTHSAVKLMAGGLTFTRDYTSRPYASHAEANKADAQQIHRGSTNN